MAVTDGGAVCTSRSLYKIFRSAENLRQPLLNERRKNLKEPGKIKVTTSSISVIMLTTHLKPFAISLLIVSTTLLSGCAAIFDKLPHKKWGFIDKNGTMVIPAQFDDVLRDQYGGCFPF